VSIALIVLRWILPCSELEPEVLRSPSSRTYGTTSTDAVLPVVANKVAVNSDFQCGQQKDVTTISLSLERVNY